MTWLFVVVGLVAAFGVACFFGLGGMLSEIEAERVDLAAHGRRCGLNPRA